VKKPRQSKSVGNSKAQVNINTKSDFEDKIKIKEMEISPVFIDE
jgi:hypothetical protein